MTPGYFHTDANLARSAMRKYAVAQLFIMFTSVLASPALQLNVREGPALSPIQLPTSNTAQTPPIQSSVPSATPSVTNTSPTTPSTALPSTAASATPSSLSLSSPTSTSATSTTLSSVISSTASPSSITSLTPSTSSVSTTTDSGGLVSTIVVAPSPSDSSSSASPTSTATSEGSAVHSGTIIGLAVAGGIAVIALISFFIWKVTRRRFSDLDDPDEAIKWPELNRQTHASEEVNDHLSRQVSNAYSGGQSRNASLFDQSELADPYAVPPLPQFNPNQPYRDDPHAASNAGYYDPYPGPPLQPGFHTNSADGHENIQLNTYPPSLRTRSPGPTTAYDTGGRGSPALGRRSPGPGPAYAPTALGRTPSPGPATALGFSEP